MFEYKVEVHLAEHAAVVARRFDQFRSVVRLLADSDQDAVLLACQMAHTTAPVDCMPTAAFLLDFPT